MAGNSDISDRPAASTLPAELVDHPVYRVLRELGHGGMGVVYLAENKLMGRKEALKVVSRELMERRTVAERFLREIRNSAQLQHPNIVTAYSATQIGDRIVLAMEYVEGCDLAKLVRDQGPLPVAQACHFVHQVALGLQHAHERAMVHRDIKPNNLMLARVGNRAVVKILDFGLARVTHEAPLDGGLTRHGQMLGTPDYIAPEQTLSARTADIRADIYSLGCTLYYLLTGGPPFQAPSLYEILQAHQSMDATPLNLARPEVPAELAAVAAKMMAKDPANRFQTPRDVAQALKPFFKATDARAAPSDVEAPRVGPAVAVRTAAVTPAKVATSSAPARAPSAEKRAEGEHIDSVRLTDPGQKAGRLAERRALGDPRRKDLRWLGATAAACALLLGLALAWSLGTGAKPNQGASAPPAPAIASQLTSDEAGTGRQPRDDPSPSPGARASSFPQKPPPVEASVKSVTVAQQSAAPAAPVSPKESSGDSHAAIKLPARDERIGVRKALGEQPVDIRKIDVRVGVERVPNPGDAPFRGVIWPLLTATDLQAWQLSDPDSILMSANDLSVSSGRNGNLLLTKREDYKRCTLNLTMAATKGTRAFLALRAHRGPDGWRAITLPIIDRDGKIQVCRQSLDFELTDPAQGSQGFAPGKTFLISFAIDNASRTHISLTKAKSTTDHVRPPGSDYEGSAGVFVKSGTLIIYKMDIRE
jgi:hypothetical protein